MSGLPGGSAEPSFRPSLLPEGQATRIRAGSTLLAARNGPGSSIHCTRRTNETVEAGLERGGDIVLIEVETRVRALETILRSIAEKREAWSASPVMAERGRAIHVVLALPRTRHHQALVREHPGVVRAAFPAAAVDLTRALKRPDLPWPGDGHRWVAP